MFERRLSAASSAENQKKLEGRKSPFGSNFGGLNIVNWKDLIKNPLAALEERARRNAEIQRCSNWAKRLFLPVLALVAIKAGGNLGLSSGNLAVDAAAKYVTGSGVELDISKYEAFSVLPEVIEKAAKRNQLVGAEDSVGSEFPMHFGYLEYVKEMSNEKVDPVTSLGSGSLFGDEISQIRDTVGKATIELDSTKIGPKGWTGNVKDGYNFELPNSVKTLRQQIEFATNAAKEGNIKGLAGFSFATLQNAMSTIGLMVPYEIQTEVNLTWSTIKTFFTSPHTKHLQKEYFEHRFSQLQKQFVPVEVKGSTLNLLNSEVKDLLFVLGVKYNLGDFGSPQFLDFCNKQGVFVYSSGSNGVPDIAISIQRLTELMQK